MAPARWSAAGAGNRRVATVFATIVGHGLRPRPDGRPPVPETGGQRPRKAACGPGPTAGTRYIIFHSGTASPLSSSEESLPSQILRPEARPAAPGNCSLDWHSCQELCHALRGCFKPPAIELALGLSSGLWYCPVHFTPRRPQPDGRPPGPDIGGLQKPCGRPPYDDTGRFGSSSSCPDRSLPTQPE